MKVKGLLLIGGLVIGATTYFLYRSSKEIKFIAENIVGSFDNVNYNSNDDIL